MEEIIKTKTFFSVPANDKWIQNYLFYRKLPIPQRYNVADPLVNDTFTVRSKDKIYTEKAILSCVRHQNCACYHAAICDCQDIPPKDI
jgi:hypothetical protein